MKMQEGPQGRPIRQVPRSKSKSSDRQAPTARTSLPRRALRKWRPLIFPSIFRLLSLGMRDLHLIFLASSHLARAAREFPLLLFPRGCFFSLPTLGVRYSHFLFPARLHWVCAIQEFPRLHFPPILHSPSAGVADSQIPTMSYFPIFRLLSLGLRDSQIPGFPRCAREDA